MTKNSTLAYTLFAAAIVVFVASFYIHTATKEFSLSLKLEIAEQQQVLATLADVTNQNGVDSVTQSIIKDCTPDNRQKFETMLKDLQSPEKVDLVEMEKLFDACASFFSERKAVMVARLQREYDFYVSLVELYKIVDESDAYLSYNVTDWARLVALEASRRDLLSEQVEVQRTIISALKSPQSNKSVIDDQLVRAQQITQASTGVNLDLANVREKLQRI